MISTDEYIKVASDARTDDELAAITGQFLSEQCENQSLTVIKHVFRPEPYHLIYSGRVQFNFIDWQKDFQKFNQAVFPFQCLEFSNMHYIFNDADYSRSDNYLLMSNQVFSPSCLSIVRIWNLLMRMMNMHSDMIANRLETDYANLAAQLMHDLQAIINLSRNCDLSDDLRTRIQFQQKVNDNFLFYIRETELLQTSVPVAALLNSCLEILGIRSSMINIEIDDKIDGINVDVELFAKAFNEIIKNALSAVDNDPFKISVHTKLHYSKSPLHSNDWIALSINDKGNGISKDFLDRVASPFFTTHKNEGSPGFGLTVAKKIIDAHMGHLEITSKIHEGTTVAIYLPVFR